VLKWKVKTGTTADEAQSSGGIFVFNNHNEIIAIAAELDNTSQPHK
jgi:hypothetical protein